MVKLKYYVIDTLLNEASKGFSDYNSAECYITGLLEDLPFAYRQRSRYLIIPKWSKLNGKTL